MASLRQVTVFFFLGVSLTSADRMDIILKRLEEMDKQLGNQNERIAELENENLEKMTIISNLQEQLETVNFEKTAEIAKLQNQLADNDEKISQLIDKKAESADKQTENVDNLAENVDNLTKNVDNLAKNVDNLAENVDNLAKNVDCQAESVNKQAGNDGRKGDSFAVKLDHDDKLRKEKQTITDDSQTSSTGMRARSSLSRRLVLGEGMQVAFSATITPHDYGPVGAGQIVKFDKVISNVGNAYHAHSGIFTSPVDGVYFVYVSISGWKHTLDHSYLEIVKNGNHLYEIWAAGGLQSSQAIIVDLDQGDEIYVRNTQANDVLLGATYSSFSGFLLYLE